MLRYVERPQPTGTPACRRTGTPEDRRVLRVGCAAVRASTTAAQASAASRSISHDPSVTRSDITGASVGVTGSRGWRTGQSHRAAPNLRPALTVTFSNHRISRRAGPSRPNARARPARLSSFVRALRPYVDRRRASVQEAGRETQENAHARRSRCGLRRYRRQ